MKVDQLSRFISRRAVSRFITRGWLCSIRSGERRIVWADEKELTRLPRLAEHQQAYEQWAEPQPGRNIRAV